MPDVAADSLLTAAASPAPAGPAPTAPPTLVILDDDPTGTQTVGDLPIVTRWEHDDLAWAFDRPGAAFCVLTNTRSLSSEDAVARTVDVLRAVDAAAAGRAFTIVSRGDSTLRGHHVDEVETIRRELRALDRGDVDAVVMVPAFPSAGRVTVDGVHLVREDGELVPAGRSSFAADPTFGYESSDLRDWLAERSGGRIGADQVESIGLDVVRGPLDGLVAAIEAVVGGRHLVVDAETDDDLERLARASRRAEARGRRLLYRIGPGLVRPLLDQEARAAIPTSAVAERVAAADPGTPHGLVVVGSHVPLSTRQWRTLVDEGADTLASIVVDVRDLVDPATASEAVERAVGDVVAALAERDVVLSTSRDRVDGIDGADSLSIARAVSRAIVDITRRALADARPAFVIGKGGITSSDLATEAVGLRRAVVLGTLLPGMVSVWQSADPAAGAFPTPYAVFPGNVGSDDSLWRAVEAFRAAVNETGYASR